jgi:hypothetical protein
MRSEIITDPNRTYAIEMVDQIYERNMTDVPLEVAMITALGYENGYELRKLTGIDRMLTAIQNESYSRDRREEPNVEQGHHSLRDLGRHHQSCGQPKHLHPPRRARRQGSVVLQQHW